jgi:hypothetical protein
MGISDEMLNSESLGEQVKDNFYVLSHKMLKLKK